MTETYRNFKGEIRNLQKRNEFIYEIEVWALNNKPNRNGWQYTNMRGNKDQFAGTPLLIAYVNNGRTIGSGHNFEMQYDAQGNEAPSFTAGTAERIIGMLSEDKNDIRIEQAEDGTEWIVGKGFIWKWYAREAAEKIERDGKMGRPMSVSIETLVTKSHTNEDGIEVEDDYLVLGTTILGDGVTPAVDGAHIVALNALASEFKELKLRAAAFYKANEENPDDIEDDDDPADIEDDEPDDEEDDKDEIDPDDDPDDGDDGDDVGDQKQNENKTQKSNEKGETNAVKALSKKSIAELSKKFDGYKVLSAGRDENGIHVVLMSEDCNTSVYTMESEEAPVYADQIRKCEAQAVFTGEGWELAVDACELTDSLSAAVINANSKLETANADLAKANSTIEEMTAKEMKRRVSAAKAKALSTLAEFNANREQKVDSSILTKINEAIDNGDFSECENAEGEWCGEEEVCSQVLAACAVEVMKQDKETAMANNSIFAWDKLNSNGKHQNGDVQDLLARNGIRK